MLIFDGNNGIDMGGNPVSNASQVDSVVMNENGDNVATMSNLVGFKNYIINGNFDIWQRGTIFTVAPDSFIYTSDRWIVWNRSNQPVTVEISNNKGLSNLGVSPRMRLAYGIAPTTGDIIISQRIEDIKRLSSKTFTGSFYHSTIENFNISTYSMVHYGVGGDSDTPIINGSQTTTGDLSFKRYSATFNIPDFKDKTIGNYSWADFTIVAPIRTTKPLSIAQVQLEEGSVATPFENRPYGLELSLCQRYYQTWLGFLDTYNQAGQQVRIAVPFRVSMRTVPTIVITSNTSIGMSPVGASISSHQEFILTGISSTTAHTTLSASGTASAEL